MGSKYLEKCIVLKINNQFCIRGVLGGQKWAKMTKISQKMLKFGIFGDFWTPYNHSKKIIIIFFSATCFSEHFGTNILKIGEKLSSQHFFKEFPWLFWHFSQNQSEKRSVATYMSTFWIFIFIFKFSTLIYNIYVFPSWFWGRQYLQPTPNICILWNYCLFSLRKKTFCQIPGCVWKYKY